ncbi:hypothetical protein ACFYSJ_33815 [Streptomyces sp. NPDC005248]|uniref:hypothetical protein n=1 Tax=Streptomyces sp. NPDC005248 TaxID=3364709 RepID=UPI00369DC2DA
MQHREGLHELLARTGLTVVEDVRPGSLFPPEAGWRIARGIAAPGGAAREALDAVWWRRLAGRMRRLALDDPESTPADVARLARYPEAEVRRRAAEDPRLSPADAVRLLNDPVDYVRGTATRNPRLPARVLAGLLHDRATACAAVTNPAIPIPVLHRILAAAAGAA